MKPPEPEGMPGFSGASFPDDQRAEAAGLSAELQRCFIEAKAAQPELAKMPLRERLRLLKRWVWRLACYSCPVPA